MIRSMTGFGRAEASDARSVISVEARSVNHRHLDVVFRLPRALGSLELDARRMVQSRLERGRVDISVQVSPLAGETLQEVQVDAGLARRYVAAARALGDTLGLSRGEVELAWVLERPGVLRLDESEGPEPAAAWPTLAEALGRALDELVARRSAEGAALAAELRRLHAELAATVEQVALRVPAAQARREERLRERMRALLADRALDEARIATEVAAWAERTDITEELARLRAHLAQSAQALDAGGPVGRALDFLVQEMNREVNTVASKADDLELSQAALAAKGALEKMREQVQNLE